VQTANATVRWSNRALGCAAVISCLLGATILVGWHTANPLLIQAHPVFTVARYSSGFGLIAVSFSLCFLAVGWRRWLLAGGALVILIGLISLGESLGRPLAAIQARLPAPPPGYAPTSLIQSDCSTAICFLLAGLAFFWLCRRTYTARNPLIVGMLCTPLVVLSILASFGYLTGSAASFGSQHFARMSIHETLGFLLTGLALFCFLFGRNGESKVHDLRWLPLTVSAGF
jgi:hypothetical protein